MGLSVTRWGRLRELVQALLLTWHWPTLASLKIYTFVFWSNDLSLSKTSAMLKHIKTSPASGCCPDRGPKAHCVILNTCSQTSYAVFVSS